MTNILNCLTGVDMLENQVKEARQMVEESDIKYDEVARKLAMVEGDHQRAQERANQGESKIVDLEEELRVIGENLKALEVAEEKAQQREEDYKRQIKQLTDRLKTAESRSVHHSLHRAIHIRLLHPILIRESQ